MDISLGVDVVQYDPPRLLRILDVYLLVHDHDHLGQHHLAQPPQSIHHFVGVAGELLVDGYEYQIVEDAFRRHVIVDHFRQYQPRERQENALCGVPQPVVFHGGASDDRGGVDRVTSHGKRRDVEYRIVVGQGIEPGVVSEGTLAYKGFSRVHVSLQHEIGLGRDLQVNRDTLYQVNRPASQKSGEDELVDGRGQGRGRAVNRGWIAAQCDRNFQPFSAAPGQFEMPCAHLVTLPVHPGGISAVDLHPVHTCVSHAGFRIPGDDQGQGNIGATVLRPAGGHR